MCKKIIGYTLIALPVLGFTVFGAMLFGWLFPLPFLFVGASVVVVNYGLKLLDKAKAE